MISRTKAMLFVLMILVVGVAFSGCASSEITSGSNTPAVENAADKKGDTTLTGTISNKGGKFFLEGSSAQPQEIESYNLDLTSYTGKTATVTGQFSGNTLFVTKIE